MTMPDDDRERFRHLPARVLPDETVESVDASAHALPDPDEERDRFLRQAAG
jgi:hypothetical protein